MELKVTTLDGKAGRHGDALRRDLRPRAARRHPAPHGALAARQAAGRHAQDQDARRDQRRPPRRCTSRRAPAAPVTATRRRRSSAAAARRSVRCARSHAIELPKKVRALALKHALSAKAKAGAIVVVDEVSSRRKRKTKALRGAVRRSSAVSNALIIDGAEIEPNFAPRRPQHPEHRRAADPGHQRLRHPAPRHAGADQGRRRSAGGAVQMSTNAHAITTSIIAPVITEKSTRRRSTTR